MSLVRLTARDILGFVLKVILKLPQFYTGVNKIYVVETRCHCTYEGIFIWCYLESLQIVEQLWRDWAIFDKVAWRHSRGFMFPSEALGTIKFTLFIPGMYQ